MAILCRVFLPSFWCDTVQVIQDAVLTHNTLGKPVVTGSLDFISPVGASIPNVAFLPQYPVTGSLSVTDPAGASLGTSPIKCQASPCPFSLLLDESLAGVVDTIHHAALKLAFTPVPTITGNFPAAALAPVTSASVTWST